MGWDVILLAPLFIVCGFLYWDLFTNPPTIMKEDPDEDR